MLDIEYIKQIDEVLEIEGFKLVPPYQNEVVQMSNYTMYVPGDDVWILGEEFSENKLLYPLYLQRVCNAINKKYRTESFFYYRITQDEGGIIAYRVNETLDAFDLDYISEDEALEKSIVLIMDHIKEKA